MNDTETQGQVIDRVTKEETDCFPTNRAVTLTMLLNVVKRVARTAYIAGRLYERENGSIH